MSLKIGATYIIGLLKLEDKNYILGNCSRSIATLQPKHVGLFFSNLLRAVKRFDQSQFVQLDEPQVFIEPYGGSGVTDTLICHADFRG